MYQQIALVKLFQCTNFASLAQSFPKVKVPLHMHSARSMHMHYVPHHQMTYNIELFSLKSISVVNLVSIAQIFLEPADPCQINSSGLGTHRLHPTETVTTETHRLWQHTCDLHVKIICTCTACALCTTAPYFIRRKVGFAKVHQSDKFGVASSKFPYTGGPWV